MLSEQYLAMLRRLLVDTDAAAVRFEDGELWDATADAALEFTVRSIPFYGPYVVDSTTGFAGVVDDTDGLLTMKHAAWLLLNGLYRDKVNRGELGGSWKSGLEEESTTSNQKAYADALAELKQDVDSLILHKAKQVFAKRQQ